MALWLTLCTSYCLPLDVQSSLLLLHCSTAETPAGQQLLQASEWLQDECQAFLQGISAAAAAAGTGDPGSNADAAAAGGGGGNSSGSSGNSSAAAAALLQVVQHHGAHIPALFGWASRLVQQAAMRLSMPGAAAVAAGDAAAEAAAAVTAMDDGGARAADKQAAQQVKQMVVLIPGLEAVPNVSCRAELSCTRFIVQTAECVASQQLWCRCTT